MLPVVLDPRLWVGTSQDYDEAYLLGAPKSFGAKVCLVPAALRGA